MKRNWNDHSGN